MPVLGRRFLLSLLLSLVLAACGPPPPTSTPQLTVDPFYEAQGGGEPRGTAYWLLWNSCAPDNRAQTAEENGGREAGWILMDDLLAEPGILMGERQVTSCEEGVALLRDAPQTLGEPAGTLAGQLLAAQLNLAVGAETCRAAEETVQGAQLLLLAGGFDGDSLALEGEAEAAARELAEQLATYNSGALCR